MLAKCTTLIINKLKKHTSEVFSQRNTADQANLQLLQPSSTSTQPWYLRQGECILCMKPLLPGSTFGFRCGHYCMCSCYQQDPRSIQDGSAKRNCQVPGCYAQCEKYVKTWFLKWWFSTENVCLKMSKVLTIFSQPIIHLWIHWPSESGWETVPKTRALALNGTGTGSALGNTG